MTTILTPTAHFPDISHFEPVEDFHAIATGGCPMVVCKATQGLGYTDPTFAPFAARIRSVPGLVLGAYMFEDMTDDEAQSKHFFSVAHLRPGDCQPFLDAEKAGLTRQQVTDTLDDWHSLGYEPIPYWNHDYYINVMGAPTEWPMWLAAYEDQLPSLPASAKVFAWQHTDHGICPGVGQPVDMSYLYVPVADLGQYCIA